MGSEESAGTLLPLFIFNLEAKSSQQQLRRPVRSDDEGRRALALPCFCFRLRSGSLSEPGAAHAAQRIDQLWVDDITYTRREAAADEPLAGVLQGMRYDGPAVGLAVRAALAGGLGMAGLGNTKGDYRD
jgi:hypothetical protein